jgi:phosphohistidine swiveling domain-containing protein
MATNKKTASKKSTSSKTSKASSKKEAKVAKEKEKKVTKSTTEKQSSESKRYFSKPAWLVHWHNRLLQSKWLSGGILTMILLILAASLWHVPLKLLSPNSIASLLPAEDTLFFMEWDQNQAEAVAMPAPFDGWSAWIDLEGMNEALWVGSQRAVAKIMQADGSTAQWYFVSVTDRALAETYVDELGYSDVLFTGDHVAWGLSESDIVLIENIQAGTEPSLENSEAYTQLRPRLPYESAGVFYVQTDQLESEWVAYQEGKDSANVEWRAMLQDMSLVAADAFPVIFGTWTQQADNWVMEAQAWGDKSVMDNAALFHFENRYKADLLSQLPAMSETVWGMQNPAAFAEQSVALLNAVDGLSGWILDGWQQQFIDEHWGEDTGMRSSVEDLFSNEVALAWVPMASCETIVTEELEQTTEEGLEDANTILVESSSCTSTTEVVGMVELDKGSLTSLETLVSHIVDRGWLELNSESGTIFHSSIELKTFNQGSDTYRGLIKDGGVPLLYYRVTPEEDQLWLTQSTEAMALLFDVAAIADQPLDADPRYTALDEVGGQGDVVYITPLSAMRLNFFDDGIHLIQVIPRY